MGAVATSEAARPAIEYLLDGRALQDGSAVRGIGTYVRGLLSGFATVGVAGVGLLLERGAPLPAEAASVAVHPTRLARVNRHLRPSLDPLQVALALRRHRPALYHAVEYAQPVQAPVPVVATVHDLVPFVMPSSYPWMRRERALAVRQLRRADQVIAVSAATARDVLALAGVDERRLTVVHEGVGHPRRRTPPERAELVARLGLPPRFVLAVGTFDPRKRVGLLAEVVRRVRHQDDVALVVAGHQGSFAGAVRDALVGAGIAAATTVLGHVSGDDLETLYQLAECLIFTSAYEGFGLPPLEAMAAGCPVVAFANSSIPEVTADAAALIADGDAAAMAAAVGAILADPDERRRRAALGSARAAQLTWSRTAEQTLAVYHRALAR